MKAFENFDVIIVGGGISGSYVGYLLASNDINVAIIEKSTEFKKDSGIVSNKIYNFIKINDKLIKQKIRKMKLFFGSYAFQIKAKKPFAIILDREKFGKYLREKAVNSGAKIIFDEIINIKIKKDKIEAIGRKNRYDGKILVGADGTNSTIRKCLGISAPKIYLGYLCNYIKTHEKNSKEVLVYHNKRYSNRFYAWKIEANEELGIITELRDCKKSIDNFLSDIKREDNEIIVKKRYYNLIPFGVTKSWERRSILVGDACGQVKPLTGGGIVYSLICAKRAVEVINEFLETEDEKIIKNYETIWKRDIGIEIWFQERLRDLYEKLDQRDIEKIARKIKDLDFEELDYDNSIDIAKKIFLQSSKIDLIKIIFLLFKYFFC